MDENPFGVKERGIAILQMLEDYLEAKKILEAGHRASYTTEENLLVAEESLRIMLDNVMAIRACYKPSGGQA